ncbi:hypothetical protein J6590_051737 [Homalodisca vitripennis]|nr:hypothetical protein J6590_051737 [Homalodisca vitripennis]
MFVNLITHTEKTLVLKIGLMLGSQHKLASLKHGAHCDRPGPAQSGPAFNTQSKCIRSNGHPPTATGLGWAEPGRSQWAPCFSVCLDVASLAGPLTPPYTSAHATPNQYYRLITSLHATWNRLTFTGRSGVFLSQ